MKSIIESYSFSSPDFLSPHNHFREKSRMQKISFRLMFFAIPFLVLFAIGRPTNADTGSGSASGGSGGSTTTTSPTTSLATPIPQTISTKETSSPTPVGGIVTRDQVIVDPQDLSIALQDALECTPARSIKIKLTGRNVTQFVLSEDPQFVGVNWQDFPLNNISPETKIIDWELSSSDGEKTLYVIFRSSTGNTSATMKDTIRLDTVEACGEVTTEVTTLGEEIEVLGEEIEKPECHVECSRVSYRIYIINPGGERRYMESIYAKIEDLGNKQKRVRFEDSGIIDQDFNDVSIMVNENDCQNLRFSLEATTANWHHKIGVEILLDNEVKQNKILWQDSHLGKGLTLSMNGASDEAMCEAEILESHFIPASAVLYEEPNFQGRFQSYTKDNNNLKLEGLFLNDAVSSIQLRGNITVFLYSDKDFHGHEERFTVDDPDLKDNSIGSDTLSSFKILPLEL